MEIKSISVSFSYDAVQYNELEIGEAQFKLTPNFSITGSLAYIKLRHHHNAEGDEWGEHKLLPEEILSCEYYDDHTSNVTISFELVMSPANYNQPVVVIKITDNNVKPDMSSQESPQYVSNGITEDDGK